MSDTRLELLLIYSGVMNFFESALNVAILLTVVVFVFDVPLSVNIPAALVVIVLTITSLSGIGLMTAITVPLGLLAIRLGFNQARRVGSLAQY